MIEAIRAAAEDAEAFIEEDRKTSVEICREITGDKTTSVDDLLDLLARPGMMQWNLQPQGTMKFARHPHEVGTLKTRPPSWKDYYLPIAPDPPGG